MIGKTISQYTILEQLGSGGMGVVYKAKDTKLGRVVALKFLPPQFSSDEGAKRRFMQEAQAASALDDPHICTIHDIAEAEDGQLFIVMAFYDGTTLKYLVDSEDLDIERATSIARQAALGLGTAHANGIVHRDVKPANIMVTERGIVKILDFGVAKLGESSDLTREGSTIGTAAYMSPEQARGESVDYRSDIWSIGAMLYELLSGKRPFGGGYEAAVAYSILNEDPAPLSDIPEELAAIVASALSKDPSARPTSAVDLANALAPFAGASVVQTRERPALVSSPTEQAPQLQAIILRFTVGAAVALGALYAAMIALGLPDWVFPVGVLLALIGLPIILYSASLDKQRAFLDSGERKKLTGLRAWLTTKRAYQGGMLAAGGLLIAILGFVGLRAAGIGPFATLISGGTLSEQDLLVIADFDNTTEDASLGFTVTEAFRIDLSQSSAVRLMDRSAVKSTLQRMQVNADTTLSSNLALQIAEREGAKGVIEGDITAAGAGFILNARILSGTDGSQLAAFRESARSDADILDAIDRLSAKLREGIGESLIEIRSDRPLEQVTTSNTEALRLYTQAMEMSSAGNMEEALELLRRVAEMDSTFAMGYRKQAVLMRNLGYPSDSVATAIRKGYALRDRLPLRERLLLEAYYEGEIEEDPDEQIRIYEDVLRRYPYEETALNNLSLLYNSRQRFEESEPLLRRALEVEDGAVFYGNLIYSVTQQGRLDDALTEIERYDEALPGLTRAAVFRVENFYLRDDFEAAEAWADSMETRANGAADLQSAKNNQDNIRIAQGKIVEAKTYRDDRQKIARDRFPESDPVRRERDSLFSAMDYAHEVALITGDNRVWRSLLDEVVEHWNSNPQEEDADPYAFFAVTLATMGFPEEAQGWVDQHEAFHERTGEEMSDNGRAIAAYTSALNGNDIQAAIDEIEDAISNFSCLRCWRDALGDLELLQGNLSGAIQQYEEFTSRIDGAALYSDEGTMAVGLFRLGDMYEQRGDLDPAIEAYTRMAERWKDADAVLQPQVEEAQRRIQALLDRKAREN